MNAMCRAGSAWALASALSGLVANIPVVDGHAYLMKPISRPFWYTPVFHGHNFAEVEYCPHCMQARGPDATRERAIANTPSNVLQMYNNGEWPHKAAFDRGELAKNGNFLEPDSIAVRHGICGDPEQTQDEGSNKYSRANGIYPVLDSYKEGQVIEMKVAMSVYHWGHLEFFLCNTDDLDDPEGVAVQSCFNKYPLTRASDDGSASPIDPTYPGRYYVDPPCREFETDQSKPEGSEPGAILTARYVLPQGVTCDRCIMQMIYYTSHKCTYPGYREFRPNSFPSQCAPTKEDWFDLGPELCGENGLYPEEFWNCADISITSDGSSSSPTPEPVELPSEPSPTPEPSATPEPADDSEDDPKPVYEPEPMSSNENTVFSGNADCSDPADYFEPCDSCCIPGYECQEMAGSGSFTECRPVKGGCADDWKQCGGSGWTGPTCCWPGAKCSAEDGNYSHCVPQKSARTPRPSRIDHGSPLASEGCGDPVAPYEQCGGGEHSGSTCCRVGYLCEEMEIGVYSECRPMDGACANDWDQCGGGAWSGTTCCWPGAVCVRQTQWFDQCIPVEEL